MEGTLKIEIITAFDDKLWPIKIKINLLDISLESWANISVSLRDPLNYLPKNCFGHHLP